MPGLGTTSYKRLYNSPSFGPFIANRIHQTDAQGSCYLRMSQKDCQILVASLSGNNWLLEHLHTIVHTGELVAYRGSLSIDGE